MTHPLDTSDVHDNIRQYIYDVLAKRVRPISVVLREAKQETQDTHTTIDREVEE